jgi:hypothetical protein
VLIPVPQARRSKNSLAQRKPRTAKSREPDKRRTAQESSPGLSGAGSNEAMRMKSYDFFLFALKAALAINGGAAVAA